MTAIWRLAAIMDDARPAVENGEILRESWAPIREELMVLLDRVRELFEGLRLFGDEDVRKRAEDMDTFYFARSETDFRLALIRGDLAELRERHITDLLQITSDDAWTSDLWELREAMRRDVGRATR